MIKIITSKKNIIIAIISLFYTFPNVAFCDSAYIACITQIAQTYYESYYANSDYTIIYHQLATPAEVATSPGTLKSSDHCITCPDPIVTRLNIKISKTQLVQPTFNPLVKGYGNIDIYFYDPCLDSVLKFCITKGWSCANGDAVALEITICDVEGYPTGSSQNCGDMDTANKIDLGIIDGQVFENPNCGCNLTQDDVMNLCAQIDEEKAKCDDCSTKDTDNDGVNDCDDWCPDTPSASTVSEHGCPENDSDGDGVLDGIDQCPDTPPNTQVDAWGCPIEQNPDSDVDGDGVPDTEDNCPYEGGTVDVNGCPINNPQPEPDPDGGDQDNDNALLEGIIGWLKKLVGVTDDVGDKVDAVGQKVDDVGDKIQEFKNAFDEFTDTEGVSTDLPEDDDFNGDLPEDFEEIDLESDFMSDFLGGLLQNNAFIQQITGSTLTASGACSLSGSISVFGRSMTINFSICEYDLTVFRAMILMIAGLTGFFIVFRKG